MSVRQKIVQEMRVVFVVTLYFAVWFGVLMALKRLYLADYQIQFRGLATALFGAFIVAKVVLVMEHVSLGQWVRNHAVAIDILLRTFICTVGVALALLAEKGFEARHEHGGFFGGVTYVFENRNMHRVWADTIAISAALLVFNCVGAIRRHLGEGRLHRVFLSPPAGESKSAESEKSSSSEAHTSSKQDGHRNP